MNLGHKRLFLIDGCGALLSAVMLSLVLTSLHEYIGMPKSILLWLGGVALLFAIYSFGCYKFLNSGHAYFLRGIAMVNFLYLLTTLSLVVIFWSELTHLGMAYFIVESGVILGLVVLELKS